MDYTGLCPRCRRRHVYFSHEIGTVGQCLYCGEQFVLPAQPRRVVRWLLRVTAVALLVSAAVYFVLDGFGVVTDLLDALSNKR
jgi:hypothetical protein